MPELPEAETIVRTLAPHIQGQSITSAEFLTLRARPGPIPDLTGRTVRDVRRYGKQVLLELDRGYLAVQLRMTGLLLWNAPRDAYTRAIFRFPDGNFEFNDIRQFGSIRYLTAPPTGLGPDPLEIPPDSLFHRLHARRALLKRLLLDQRFLRGLGNIYVDEILFRARIHPRARSDRLTRTRAERLHTAMRQVLAFAVEKGGSSISDYVDANGEKGTFQLHHQVYAKAGRPCPTCATPIRRIVVSQRGTHYCPRCQRA